MIVLLLPLVVAILVCERIGVLYPPETAAYDSLLVHTFVLTGDPKSTAKCERFEAQTCGGKVYLYILRDSTRTMPQRGDTVIAETRIRHADSIGDFDYRKYLLRQSIIGTAFVGKGHRVHFSAVRPHPSWQKRLYERLADAGLSGDELATTGALTLGYKEDIDPTLRRHFQASGAAHVLAVSGLHTGIIYALLLWLLTFGGRRKPLYDNRFGRAAISLVIIAAMWGYAWLTGLTPSVVRAVLMVTIFEVGRMFYRQAISLNTIAAAAVLILLVRPLDLWSVSFQLSFSATAAIVLVANEMGKLVHYDSLRRLPGGRFLNWVVGILIVSFAAQLGTLPLTMHYFGQISNYFLLTNLIVLPLASLLVPCGLATVALGGSTIGLWVGKLTTGLAWLMNHSVAWLEALPGSTTHVSIGTTMVAIYYAMWLVFLLCYSRLSPKNAA